MAAPPAAATAPIIRKKFAFSMLLQKPPSQPPRISPGKLAASHRPIIKRENARGRHARDERQSDRPEMQLAERSG